MTINCFVIMPFRPELHYIFLYLKKHLEENFSDLECKRADDKVLTSPLLEKINNYIQEADVVIADITGRNANVFYELGMAHACDKSVILMTADPIDEVPTDIKCFEIISYGQNEPETFIRKLDNALEHVIKDPYVAYFREAQELLEAFRLDTGLVVKKVQEKEFKALLDSRRPIPKDLRIRNKFLIHALLGLSPDRDILDSALIWMENQT